MTQQNPAQTSAHPSGGERVQPGSPLLGEVKRGGELDTSGEIVLPYPHLHPNPRGYQWPDLDPFTQGYIEALFADGISIRGYGGLMACLAPNKKPCGFSDLAPETLAAILKDFAAWHYGQFRLPGVNTSAMGRSVWAQRQRGELQRFPPLTAYLGGDSKVYLRAA